MSALLGFRRGDCIDLLTDAAATRNKDGTVSFIHDKQFLLESGIVVAGIGLWRPAVIFARLIDACAKNLDDTVELAPMLWQKVRAKTHPESRLRRCSIVLAGYSTKVQRVQMHIVHETSSGDCEFWPDTAGYVAGPGSDTEIVKPFTARFSATPHAFDACRDGIELFEELRRHSLRDTEAGPRHAVGGFVQHTTIARRGIETKIIHHWPDVVGELIDPDAVLDPRRKPDTSGLAMADVQWLREASVNRKMAMPQASPELTTAPQITADDYRKVANALLGQVAREAMN